MLSQTQQLPGAWFYEMGPLDEPGSGSASTGIPDDCSPMMEMMLDERLAHRHTTESVEVPSSEHVAEIVGRQGLSFSSLLLTIFPPKIYIFLMLIGNVFFLLLSLISYAIDAEIADLRFDIYE
uniref:Uncharacterized protein n=1 Tax=Panagrolaimus superbus TaxID=310955 RepID=A0A914YQD4_9BILA